MATIKELITLINTKIACKNNMGMISNKVLAEVLKKMLELGGLGIDIINDTIISLTTTWSSTKIDQLINSITANLLGMIVVLPADLDGTFTTYENLAIKDKFYRIFQNGIGRFLELDEYIINPLGGFTLVNPLNSGDSLFIMGTSFTASSISPSPGGDTLIPTWINSRTYKKDEPVVQYDGDIKMLYRSKINGNVNNDPNAIITGDWTLVGGGFVSDPLFWSSSTEYSINEYALFNAAPGINALVQSTTNNNLNNPPQNGAPWTILGLYLGLYDNSITYAPLDPSTKNYVRFDNQLWWSLETTTGGLPLPTNQWEAITDFTTVIDYINSIVPIAGSGLHKIGDEFRLGLDTTTPDFTKGKLVGTTILHTGTGLATTDNYTLLHLVVDAIEFVFNNSTTNTNFTALTDYVGISFNPKDVVDTTGLFQLVITRAFQRMRTSMGSQHFKIELEYNIDNPNLSKMEVLDEVRGRGLGDKLDYSANKQPLDYATKMMLDTALNAAGGTYSPNVYTIEGINSAIPLNEILQLAHWTRNGDQITVVGTASFTTQATPSPPPGGTLTRIVPELPFDTSIPNVDYFSGIVTITTPDASIAGTAKMSYDSGSNLLQLEYKTSNTAATLTTLAYTYTYTFTNPE